MTFKRKLSLLAITGCYVGSTCAQITDFSVPSKFTAWDNEKWTLSTDKLIQGQYQSRLNLANGYFGCAQAAAGPFFEADRNLTDADGEIPVNGWPLFNPRQTFCTVTGLWDSQPNTTKTNFPWLLGNGGESIISGIPHWGAVIFEFGADHLDATVSNDTISNFQSTLSARDGVASWSYQWAPESAANNKFQVHYTLIISRSRSNVAAVRAEITPSADSNGTVTDLLDGRSSVRSTFVNKGIDENATSIFAAVSPDGLPETAAYVISSLAFDTPSVDTSSRKLADQDWVSANETTIGQTYDVKLKAGVKYTFDKYVGVASSDAFPDPESVARNASRSAQSLGWDSLIAEHKAAWAETLPKSAIDDFTGSDGKLPDDPNILNMQISSVLTPFYLLQNTLKGNAGPSLGDNSISVAGLSGDSYGGLVFWDADLFMSPGLVVADPLYARTIANYRIAKSDQARENAKFNNFSSEAILYPWTSGRFGNCTGTGPCVDYQYHLNSDIAQMLLQHRNVTGDEKWWRDQAWPIYQGVAQMFSELLKYNETTKKYDVKNMTDPDEYANGVDNGAFTLASASKILSTANLFRARYGMEVNETWSEIADNVAIPYDSSGITAEYDGMNNSVPVKQADVVLNTYPLNYRENYTQAQSLQDLDYYAGKQSADGPAMTYGILSIIANQVSPSGCSAFTYALDSFQPYSRAPWYQFSEQQIDDVNENGGTNPAFPFLTGHGGFNQLGPFGWLGLRTDAEYLLIDPDLPPQIPQLKLRHFYYGGATLNATLNATHTRLSRSKTTSTFFNDTYDARSMPVLVGQSEPKVYELNVGQTITISNRQASLNKTLPGNLLQCLPATSPDPHAPGLFPLAAIDGAISTSWQPTKPSRTSLLVDMTSVAPQVISAIAFNWGAIPPKNATVLISNSSTFNDNTAIIPLDNITISKKYDPGSVKIAPFAGNETYYTIEGDRAVYSGKYAMLQIEGTQGPDETVGATVAEFALIAASSGSLSKRGMATFPRFRR
ncbi:MAG: hypothetical protein M1825_002328 [Sarcosagium campestre]|nr:MAG: hypothetical protein M1825_002328 [Sarcosagium campestre]